MLEPWAPISQRLRRISQRLRRKFQTASLRASRLPLAYISRLWRCVSTSRITIDVRRSSTDRRLDETFCRPHGSRSADDASRETRYLRFSRSKRSGEINHAENAIGSDKTYVRRNQVSGTRFDLGVPARTLARRSNHRDARVL